MFGIVPGVTSIPITDPWDWHIYLHEWLLFMAHVGKYTIQGSYGNEGSSKISRGGCWHGYMTMIWKKSYTPLLIENEFLVSTHLKRLSHTNWIMIISPGRCKNIFESTNFSTRWFKVTFWSPSWRSLNPLNHPKKGHKELPGIWMFPKIVGEPPQIIHDCS